MELELTRSYFSKGTNGTLAHNGHPICATIELPWKNNRARISCIPEGRYRLVKRYSPKFGNHFLLEEVPCRTCILVHPANDAMLELKGCIAPVSLITGSGRGASSRKAMALLTRYLAVALENKEPVFITIKSKEHEKNS
jgi:hypothetical protein